MDTLISDLAVEDVIIITAMFFAAVLGFTFGFRSGKGR
jgi:hypothetical protein